MRSFFKTKIVKFGKSHGVIIPKVWFDFLALKNGVELRLDSGQIFIRPANRPRHNWEAQFQVLAAKPDDQHLGGELSSPWEKKEWEW